MKPSLGMVSRTHIVPISQNQDTAGPMARSVMDAALLVSIMAGSDANDPATKDADSHKPELTADLASATLRGKRLGVIVPPDTTDVGRLFASALAALHAAGAEIVPIPEFDRPPGSGADQSLLLEYDLKHDLNAYLASLPPGQPKSLADLIEFNRNSPRELVLFGQDLFEAAQARGDVSDAQYQEVLTRLKPSMRALLDRTLAQFHVDALIQPTAQPAFRIDLVRGDNRTGGGAAGVPAIAGYPHLTLPMGQVKGLPVGLSLIGPQWGDGALLAMGYAAQKALPTRRPPLFKHSIEAEPLPAIDPVPN
jgi:amidase